MKVLFVTPAVPGPAGGGSGRMLEQLRYLRAAGVKADLLSYSVSGDAAEAGGLADNAWVYRPEEGPAVRAWNLLRCRAYSRFAGFAGLLRRRLDEGGYDLVHVHKFQMAGYLAGLGAPPVVVDLWACGLGGIWRDALAERAPLRAAIKLSWLPRLYLADRSLYPAFDNYFVVSEEARRYVLDRWPGKRVYVVPHGVRLPPKTAAVPAGGGLLFLGDMSFAPNVDAVLFFHEKVLPLLRRRRPGLRFYIVGRDPAPEILALRRDAGVTVTGYVENTGPWLEKAAVFVAPIRGGLGLRTKLLEAFAHGLPVVTTRRACEGIPARDGGEVLLAESAEEFAARTESLLADPAAAAALGGRARKMAEKEFSWPVIAAGMKRAYDEILGRYNIKG